MVWKLSPREEGVSGAWMGGCSGGLDKDACQEDAQCKRMCEVVQRGQAWNMSGLSRRECVWFRQEVDLIPAQSHGYLREKMGLSWQG